MCKEDLKCEGALYPCEQTEGLRWESGRTSYHWNGVGEDPNRCRLLCVECAKEWHAYWDEMWSYAYGG